MNLAKSTIFATSDQGLLRHWQNGLTKQAHLVETFSAAKGVVGPESLLWLDLSLPEVPAWVAPDWKQLLGQPHLKVVACSSSPTDAEGIAALDAGCSAYCHAYSDPATLVQIKQVVEAGQIWIGSSLMQKLIRGAKLANRPDQVKLVVEDWSVDLTPREKEVAFLAANGASNQLISSNCAISERTVKAHLSAVFQKLNLTDRLQLALRVHGIS
ncbi:transcriptional regulatory, luxR family protein [Rhodoferax antarcticus ANT.BR]|uniref:Transcriptional regulatory, luxR family protein n=1 Tax=Rhodoferax antarcticus ANT.BR TaxID=1111071 RepID=A0A1Q8YAH5_9BURK|nr:hypothetical protein RA876_12830 [Rhodoferax antarcticus]OLP04983.1 transcriptional regulatory, luxR family protein [Rhodoferax antarcticus ANT.BR]